MKNSITTIIFDVGGVLLRTEDRRPRTMLADAFGMTYEQLETIVFNGESGHAAQRGEITAEQHWEWVRSRLNLKPDEVGPVSNTFFSGDVLDRELLAFVNSLKPEYKTAIITNAFDDFRAKMTDKLQLDKVFSTMVVSAEEGVMKPDPLLYEITLERCGVSASEAVFIDDFPQNVKAAKEVGMLAIWFRSREQTILDMKNILGLNETNHS